MARLRDGLRAEYFIVDPVASLAAIDFSAAPAFVAEVDRIQIDAAGGAFWIGGPSNDFAARYAGVFTVETAGDYTFHLTSDDGSVLYVDGQKIIDNDAVQPATEQTATLTLGAGSHDIEVRYFERGGLASLSLDWSGPDAPERGAMVFEPQPATRQLRAEYFDVGPATSLSEIAYTGAPDAIGRPTSIDEPLTAGGFWLGGPVDGFAARYLGPLDVTAEGAHTFYLASDDGAALLINGVEALTNDGVHPTTEVSATVELTAGVHEVEVRYFENFGFAELSLEWSGPSALERRPVSFDPVEAVTPVDLSFRLPEDAVDAPLALSAAGGFDPELELEITDGPAFGALTLSDGAVFYTPNADYVGADRFAYQATDADGVVLAGAVTLQMLPSHEQPQTVFNPNIAPEISPSGEALILRRVAEIPDAVTGAKARMNQALTHEDAVYIVVDGNVSGEGPVYRLTPDGAGGYETELWFDFGPAIEAATGRALNNANVAHGGVRSLAFHPDFETNGKIYISAMEGRPDDPSSAAHRYISDVSNPVVADGVVIEWTVDLETGAVDPESYREVFRIGMPVFDHPVKQIAFNPYAVVGDEDYGLLYVAHGDGSVQSATAGGGQNNDGLGKILRVDPLQQVDAPYGVPDSNPFVDDPDMIDEAYAIGFRNPHRLFFNEASDGSVHLVSSGVGRDNFDEVNIIEKGGNYGWSEREGPLLHKQAGGGTLNGIDVLPENDGGEAFIYPATFYGHQAKDGETFVGQAIAGGVVIQTGGEMSGELIFADFSSDARFFHVDFDEALAADTTFDPGETPSNALSWATPSEIMILYDHDGDAATDPILQGKFTDILGTSRSDVRFGVGPDGELLVINKRDGFVYAADNTRAPDDPFFQATPQPTIALVGTDDADDISTGDDGAEVLALAGDDRVTGGRGVDVLRGQVGADDLFGRGDADRLFGGPDGDRAYGGPGDDRLYGNGGQDRLFGNGGADRVFGHDGDDRLFGADGADRLFGGAGDDRLRGGDRADVLVGGVGADVLRGEGGVDVFAFSVGDGEDRIRDFEDGLETIRFSGVLGFDALTIEDAAEGARVRYGEGDVILLDGVAAAALSDDDFVFA